MTTIKGPTLAPATEATVDAAPVTTEAAAPQEKPKKPRRYESIRPESRSANEDPGALVQAMFDMVYPDRGISVELQPGRVEGKGNYIVRAPEDFRPGEFKEVGAFMNQDMDNITVADAPETWRINAASVQASASTNMDSLARQLLRTSTGFKHNGLKNAKATFVAGADGKPDMVELSNIAPGTPTDSLGLRTVGVTKGKLLTIPQHLMESKVLPPVAREFGGR